MAQSRDEIIRFYASRPDDKARVVKKRREYAKMVFYVAGDVDAIGRTPVVFLQRGVAKYGLAPSDIWTRSGIDVVAKLEGPGRFWQQSPNSCPEAAQEMMHRLLSEGRLDLPTVDLAARVVFS